MCPLLALLLLPAISHCVSVRYERPHIISKSKVELTQKLITCRLNDIAIIAAPLVDTKSRYLLYKPNNDVIELDLPRPHNKVPENDTLVVKYINNEVKSIYPIKNNRVINPSYRHHSNEDVVKDAEMGMKRNEFMIGPLLEEDHGNWLLSVYFKDIDDNWIELFQVISIEIVETVPVLPKWPKLRVGDTLRISFAFPIMNLQSCELIAPSSTYDRFFDSTQIDLDRCGYVVTNLTKEDEGVWELIGVGKMVFQGLLNLQAMRVSHFYDRSGVMIVEGVLHGGRNLDYCRFVRIDGFGFTTGNIVPGYANTGSNTYGICQISIRNPTILDMHPWTVVAKIRGHDKEISKDTMDSIIIAPYNSYRGMGGFTIFLYVFMSVVLAAIIMGACLGPKKNREWTYARASSIRTSIRNSMRKPPLPPQAPISQQV